MIMVHTYTPSDCCKPPMNKRNENCQQNRTLALVTSVSVGNGSCSTSWVVVRDYLTKMKTVFRLTAPPVIEAIFTKFIIAVLMTRNYSIHSDSGYSRSGYPPFFQTPFRRIPFHRIPFHRIPSRRIFSNCSVWIQRNWIRQDRIQRNGIRQNGRTHRLP